MRHHRLIQASLLVVGLVAIAVVVARTVDEASEQVMPSPAAWAIGGVLALVAITSSARAWAALFSDLLTCRARRVRLLGTFYVSQVAKYLPVGGVAQAAGQLGLAPAAGVPLSRAAVAFPVSALGAVVAGLTLGIGLVLDDDLAAWVRILAACGLLATVLLRRELATGALRIARRAVKRLPDAELVPTQRDIFRFYAWAVLTIAALCTAYAVLLGSLDTGAKPLTAFSAFAVSWVVGFLAVPIPAGVGVREAVLVGLMPGVGAAPLLSASLALRLLAIGTELLAIAGNKLAAARLPLPPAATNPAAVAAPPDASAGAVPDC